MAIAWQAVETYVVIENEKSVALLFCCVGETFFVSHIVVFFVKNTEFEVGVSCSDILCREGEN